MGNATVKVVGLSGGSTTTDITVKRGATVGDVLAAAGVSPEGKDITLARKAVGGEAVQEGDVVTVSDPVPSGSQVTVRERPQGS